MLSNFFNKLSNILSTVEGWIAGAGIVLANFITGYESTFTFVLFAVLLDLAWGIASAVKRGQFALSELARHTFSKLAVYLCVLVFFVAFDKIVDWDGGLTFSIVAGTIVLVEAWSVCASALIVHPDLPFLRLFRKVLTGEIASKLNVSEEDVEETLNSYRINKKNI